MAFPELETPRLQLVEIKKKHIVHYYNILSMDEVTRYYGMDPLEKESDAINMINSFRHNYESKRGIRWGIIIRDMQEFAGTLGLNNLSLWSKKAELGYELHPNYWNQGIITEAARSVLNYAFSELALVRMGAVTYPQNIASIAVLEKLGFQKEGLLRRYLYQNNQSHDAYIFSLLNDEWDARA
ncbi:GNAT family N-acetyltransferase [Virgibacillus halodenitrificans]|uniref:GNAT family N-acetyltransferase n=1 Tax=Virgibacillus halodenitrificans TaxID=1482 RepID=UPI001F23C322|nr:GNAT family protein [Virgibacillus halodenitrificans]MCG1028999.1 GNAT family N-acetyltransferase [Virgibacillus halodenitrificans]WHX27853.1 GNAT family protein [Virgibacillus halodenitrificans]